MEFSSIRDKVIKLKLIDMLGKTLAEEIYTNARFASAAGKDDRERLQYFVDKACSDQRFLGMWGTAQAQKQKKEWIDLLT